MLMVTTVCTPTWQNRGLRASIIQHTEPCCDGYTACLPPMPCWLGDHIYITQWCISRGYYCTNTLCKGTSRIGAMWLQMQSLCNSKIMWVPSWNDTASDHVKQCAHEPCEHAVRRTCDWLALARAFSGSLSFLCSFLSFFFFSLPSLFLWLRLLSLPSESSCCTSEASLSSPPSLKASRFCSR